MGKSLNGYPVTIGVFHDRNTLYIAQAFLESEGIQAFIKEENMLNLRYWKGHLDNGFELQAGRLDALRARTILVNNSLVREEPQKNWTFLVKLDEFTLTIPFIKNLRFELRFLVLILCFSILVSAGMSLLILKNQ